MNKLLNDKFLIETLLFNNNQFDHIIQENGSKHIDVTSLDPFYNKDFIVNINDVEDILINNDWEDGIYGFLNYQPDLKYDKLLNRGFKFNNKKINNEILVPHNKDQLCPNDCNKCNDFNMYLNNDKYGFLELFSKNGSIITNLNTYHLIKDSNINFINNTTHKKIVVSELSDYFIMTKIYKFVTQNNETPLTKKSRSNQQQIIFITQMSVNEYIVKDEMNEQIINYHKKINNLCSDNVKLLDYMLDFNNIKLLKNILFPKEIIQNNTPIKYNIDDVMDFDFSYIISNVKVSNRYDIDEYNDIIFKYYGNPYDILFDIIMKKDGIKLKIQNEIKIILETLTRIYIDTKLNHKKFCLNKKLISYIPQEDDAYLQSNKLLIKRHCVKILNSSDSNNIINLIYQLLKTKNFRDVISYINNIIT